MLVLAVILLNLHIQWAYGNNLPNLNCGLDRYSLFKDYLDKDAYKSSQISKNQFNINKLKADLAEQTGKKKILPVELSLTSQIYRTDNDRINSLEYANNEVNELTGKIGIDIWNELSRRRVANGKEELIKHDIEDLKDANEAEVLISLIDLSKTKSLLKILKARDLLLSQKVEFYSLKKKLGENVSPQLLETRKAQVENINKINSAEVKVSNLISKLEISYSYYDLLEALNPHTDLKSDFNCNHPLKSFTKSLKSVELLKRRLSESRFDKLPKVNAFVKETKNKNNIGFYENEVKYGVEITLPLYQGGKGWKESQNIKRRIKNKEFEIVKLQEEGARFHNQRKEIEFVLINSLDIITDTLNEKKQLIEELAERIILGQSLFVEMSDATLEVNLLEESRLNIVTQFMTGWITYLEKIGRLDRYELKL